MMKKIKARALSQKEKISIQLLLGLLFALYNGIFGIVLGSVWHIEIGVYYVLLLAVKTVVFAGFRLSEKQKSLKAIFFTTAVLLFLINAALILPIISMIKYERDVPFPLEVAIGIAAYTTYKVTMTVINFVKSRKSTDLLEREIVTIRFVESIVSILTLQNTLIMVNAAAEDEGLRIICTVSSAVGLCAILYLTVKMIVDYFSISKNQQKPHRHKRE